MTWIEQPARRSPSAKHYQDSQNPALWRAEITLHDQHYHDGTAWQDVDETLQPDTTGGYVRAAAHQRHIFRVGNGGERQWQPRREVATEYVTLGRPEYWTGSRWRQIAMPVPAWNGNQATWDMASVTVTLINTWQQIKASFVLKDGSAPTRLRFPAAFMGLTYDPATGALSSGGSVRGYIIAPTAADSGGNPVACTSTYAGGYIEWGVAATGATFPIDVDPTLTLQPGPGKDAGFIANYNNWNEGASATFLVGNGSGYYYRGLYQFDLAGLPADAVISSAVLTLNEISGNFATQRFSVYRMKRSWVAGTGTGYTGTPNGVTGNTYDGVHAWTAPGGFDPADCEQTELSGRNFTSGEGLGFKDFPLSAATKAALDLGYGWLVKAANEAVTGKCQFQASEASTASQRPKLVVEYNAGGGERAFACIAG